MDRDLSHVRELIYSEASEGEKAELRKKWLEEPLLNSRTRSGVVDSTKGIEMDTFFLDLIDDEKEALDRAAHVARQAAEDAKAERLRSDTKELSRKFAKLITAKFARVADGALVFELPNSKYFYSVTLENQQFLLSVDSTPVEKFAGNGDEIRALAKVLAKNPQPKPAVAQVEITTEQRQRTAIKNFVAAFEELRKV
jgi:hypothetical protein